MKNSKMFKTIAMVMCVAALSAMSAGVALADNGISTQDIQGKQSEIDKYLFEDHADDIAALGFAVTHTAPMDAYVEIGITPYTEENADYLYGIFGSDMVKVVEGEQAVLLTGNESTLEAPITDTAVDLPKEILDKQAEIDKYLFEDHKSEIGALGFTVTGTSPADNYVEIGITPYSEENANKLYDIFGKDMVKVVEGVQAIPYGEEIYSSGLAVDNVQAQAIPVWVFILAGAAVAAGVIALVLIRRKATR
jgi:hypothetical protein